MRLFSAHDRTRRLCVAEREKVRGGYKSQFAKVHEVKSYFRCSLNLNARTAESGALPPSSFIAPFLEVFGSYKEPQSEETLREQARRAEKILVELAPTLLGDPNILPIVDPRLVAIRHRALQGIIADFEKKEQLSVRSKSRRELLRDSVETCLQSVYGFICKQIDCQPDDIAFSFHAVKDWSKTPYRDPEGTSTTDDIMDVDVYAHYATPRSWHRKVNEALGSHDHPGVCRYVARSGSSVALETSRLHVDPKLYSWWKSIYIESPVKGASVTFPLYHSDSVFGVINIETKKGLELFRKIPALWQVLPSLERLLFYALRRLQAFDEATLSASTQMLSSYVSTPRTKAFTRRLRMLQKMLSLEKAILVDVDSRVVEVFADSENEVAQLEDSKAVPLRDQYEHWEWDAGSKHTKNGSIHILRFGPHGPEAKRYQYDPKSGALTRHRPDPQHLTTLADALEINAKSVADGNFREMVVLPFSMKVESRESSTRRHALLVLVTGGVSLDFGEYRVEGLFDVRDAFSSALTLIDRLSMQKELFAWASVGVGSIHDVVQALSREAEVLGQSPSETQIQGVIKTLQVFVKQMNLIDGLVASPTTDEAHVVVPLDSFIQDVVGESAMLAGHSIDRIDVEAPANRNFSIRPSERDRVSSALNNVLSNAFKYGSSQANPAVNASLIQHDGAPFLQIQVVNRAARDRYESTLKKGKVIVDSVRSEDPVNVLYSLMRDRLRVSKFEGLGIWLTSRVVKDMLGGRYHLDFKVHQEDPRFLNVSCIAEFPVLASDVVETAT